MRTMQLARAALLVGTSLACAVAMRAAGQSSDPHAAAPGGPNKPTHAEWAFDRVKSMVGAWDADVNGDGAPDMVVTYRLIAGGSVVVETLFAGTPGEMETMFHLDRGSEGGSNGDRLLCTHYCAAGNQPRLKATDIAPDSITFEMMDATNLPDRGAMHMGKLKMVFKDKDHVVNFWTSFDKGKDMGAHEFVMKRKVSETLPTPPEKAAPPAPASKPAGR